VAWCNLMLRSCLPFRLTLACAAWVCVALGGPGAVAQGLKPTPVAADSALPTVVLQYQSRPPYYLPPSDASGAEPTGVVMEPLRLALRKSGLPHRFELAPAARQLQDIEFGQAQVCGVGWFQNPERSAKGLFSKALHQDQPLGYLMRRDAQIPELRAIDSMLSDPRLQVLVKLSFSYGAVFDAALAARERAPERAVVEVPGLVKMLLAGRADWTPMSGDEAQLHLAAHSAALSWSRFKDAAPGGTRHLYCSRAVPKAWLHRLDEALP
jgi:hypothetical protein